MLHPTSLRRDWLLQRHYGSPCNEGAHMYGFVTAKFTAPARPQRQMAPVSAQVRSLAVIGRAENAHRLKKCATAPKTTDRPQASRNRTAAFRYQSPVVIRNAAESSTIHTHRSQAMRQRYPARRSSATTPAVASHVLPLVIGDLPNGSPISGEGRQVIVDSSTAGAARRPTVC
jgi:hypothetical protein